MISVDMYVDLLPNFLRPLSRLVSTFRHKRRRSIVTIRLEPRRELLRLL